MRADELTHLPLFAGLSSPQCERLSACLSLAAYPAGAEIFAAGQRASQLFLLKSGQVVIRYHPYDGGSLDIATIEPGAAFGWSAALKHTCYTSSALCVTEVQVLAIAAHELHRLMADDSGLAGVLLNHTAHIAGSRMDGLGRQVRDWLHTRGARAGPKPPGS